jgi:eukaryotic-like serine/threonine-protein kinase
MEGASLHASLIGATIGNYKVVAKLGEGGMGAVYLAEHPLIGKKVALKVLHEEYAANQEVVSRFFNEAKAVNDIGHPNIVDIIDYGVVQTQTGPGFVYFIMEYLHGAALADVIRRESPLPPERALHIAAQIADCLAASHAKGIIHRDLKPDNVFLIPRPRETDFVKVLDFGIAKLTGNDGKSSRTRTGIVMGTPAYMSPEQCEGRGNIDHRTDIYALGILLYEMITGKVPFSGDGYGEVLVQHLTKIPERPSTIRGVIPPHVEAVVMKALEKKPADRFQSMEQFLGALRDPMGFVNASGGLGALYGAGAVTGGTGAMPATTMMTADQVRAQGGYGPPPGANAFQSQPALYPPPGGSPFQSQPGLYPAPGSQPGLARTPTTLGQGAGELMSVPRSNRNLFIIGGAVVAAAALGIGAFFLLSGGDEKKPDTVAADTTGVTPENKDDTAPQPANPTAETPKPENPTAEAPKPETPTAEAPKPETPTAEVPKPEVTPTEPTSIMINVTSVPPGASVYVASEPTPRGQTPTAIKLDKGNGEIELTFKLVGYKDKKKSVKMNRDAELEMTLDKAVKKDPTKKKDKKPADDDDVMAPSF